MAKKSKKQLTPNQQQWKKEVTRIKRAITRLRKEGYDLSGYSIPQMPTRVTKKQLEKIHSITPKKLRKAAGGKPTLPAPPTPPKPKPTPLPPLPSPPDEPPSIVDLVLRNVEAMIDSWSPQVNWSEFFAGVKERDKNILEHMLSGAIASEGREAVAMRLELHADEVIDMVQRILYDSGGKNGRDRVQADLVRMSAILTGKKLTPRQNAAMTQAAESTENLIDQSRGLAPDEEEDV